MMLTKEMLSYIAENIEDIKRIIRDLCAIPAPSHHEEKRAEYCKAWFRANGFEDVEIDEALNVVCRYQVTDENDLVVFMAHTDTVFPDTEPMPFREDEKKMYAPGVCDDTANLAVMMVSARYFVQRKLRAKCGLLFVANSCEEGLGNLKGSRRIVQDYGSRIREFYTFDGTNLRRVVTSAVGSHRYRVTVRTEGGHSYGAFGNRNAIYYLSSIINTIYTMKVPQKEGVKTTYNVGVIEGGTSVNTIAQEASMLCEYRSNDRECLETMRVFFEKTFEAYRAMGVEVGWSWSATARAAAMCHRKSWMRSLRARTAPCASCLRRSRSTAPARPTPTFRSRPGSRPSASARRWAAAAIRGRRRSISISCRTARSCRCG